MADQEARFAVDLDVKGAKGAQDLESALVGLRNQIKADQSAINEMQAAMRRLQQSGSTNTAVFKQLRDQLTVKRASLGAAQEAYVKLGGTFGTVASAARVTGGGVDSLSSTLQAAGGPIGGMAGRLAQLKDVLGRAGAAGAAFILIAAVVALIAGVVVGVMALASFGLTAANAARDTRLLFDAVDTGAGAGQRLGVQVELLAGRVALARGQLNEMAAALGRSRLQGRALEAAFSAVATMTSVMGNAAGGALQSIATDAARTRVFMLDAFSLDGTGLKIADVGAQLAKRLGVSMQAAVSAIQNGRVKVADGLAALDAAVQTKFGKIAKAQLLSFGTQMIRAKENIGGLFKDVKIEPFLEGMHGVLRLFDRSTVTGKNLKFIVETLLNPLFSAVGKALPYVQGFFKGLVIGALLVALALVRVKRAFSDAFGGESKSRIDRAKLSVYGGIAAVTLLIGAMATLAAVVAISFTPLAVLTAAVAAAIFLLLTPLIVVGAAAYGLYLAFQATYDAILKIDFGALGVNLVAGLIRGIRSGVSGVVAAVRSLTSAAVSTLTDDLKIHSPSVVGHEKGGFFAGGFSGGIDDGIAGVEAASAGMANAAAGAATAPSGAAPGRSRSAGGNIYYLTINGVKDADEMAGRSFLARLADTLEGAATSAGIPLDPEPA